MQKTIKDNLDKQQTDKLTDKVLRSKERGKRDGEVGAFNKFKYNIAINNKTKKNIEIIKKKKGLKTIQKTSINQKKEQTKERKKKALRYK